ncbi:putative peptide/nitrate transporter [Vitis vinifera]|uniref:Putative peptide/nitrate transporter n=1 Tax=Vitis vinifera TaxID=29760 RepID=A0A438JCB3_VITVI|nr:putative peptide/nitrate transporter [Vitis vinifera]
MILLIQPAEKYPNIFSKESIFGRFPYFLPCLCTSVYAFGITIACCWLQVGFSISSVPWSLHVLPTELDLSSILLTCQDGCKFPYWKKNIIQIHY